MKINERLPHVILFSCKRTYNIKIWGQHVLVIMDFDLSDGSWFWLLDTSDTWNDDEAIRGEIWTVTQYREGPWETSEDCERDMIRAFNLLYLDFHPKGPSPEPSQEITAQVIQN
jgi:hypothetical protein